MSKNITISVQLVELWLEEQANCSGIYGYESDQYCFPGNAVFVAYSVR